MLTRDYSPQLPVDLTLPQKNAVSPMFVGFHVLQLLLCIYSLEMGRARTFPYRHFI